MPFVGVTNTMSVELRYTWNGENVENTLYFYHPDSPSTALLNGICNIVFDWWEAELSAQQATEVELREIYGKYLNAVSSYEYTFPAPASSTGAVDSPSLPNNVTICVSFRTGLTGRSRRGRNYFVGLTETQVLKNIVSDFTVQAIEDAYTALIGAADLDGYTWVVLSKYSGVDPDTRKPIPRITGLTTPIIAVVCVDNVVDSQRRRLPGRGE